MSTKQFLLSIGELIRVSRADAGLTQRALGQRAGIVGKYLSDIERGTRDIPVSTLFAIVERGLQLDLDISFRRRQGATRVTIPHNVEEVARLIAQLGMEQRAKIVTVVRAIIELVR